MSRTVDQVPQGSNQEWRQLNQRLKESIAGETRAREAAERDMREAAQRAERAEQALRDAVADRDNWRARAELAEAALTSVISKLGHYSDFRLLPQEIGKRAPRQRDQRAFGPGRR
jgi:hypothetical protein